MRPEPYITPDAEADVLAAARYYESERENLGLTFLEEFDHILSLIRATPLSFTLVDHPVRRALLHRFPYGVFYVSAEEQDTILAVVDLRQDPETVRRAYKR